MRAQAISPSRLVEHVADAIAALPAERWIRVAVDGAPPAAPGELAEQVAEALRLRGRPAVHASAGDFLRPASLRLELGREDPELLYAEWLDLKALDRELLGPLEPGGSGRILPALWDAAADRAHRAAYVDLPPGGVVLLDGAFLLGSGLPFELTVHLVLSAAALKRRTAARDAWTLPAYERYEEEQDPVGVADIVARVDDPRHPALVSRD